MQLEYNANNELSKSLSITQEGLKLTEVLTTYQYDAFGRRIHKHSQTRDKTKRVNKNSVKFAESHIQPQKTRYKHSHYLWDGDIQLQEQTDSHIYTTVYDQDSFEPVARLVWLKEGLTIAANDEPENDEGWYGNDKPAAKTGIQVYHYHNDQLGTPNELTNSQGEVVWLADYQAWGNTAKVVWREQLIDQIQVSQDELQPIRFQGQHFDQETGLHYNRFRYYDPDVGMFTTRDPLGLLGGDNVFAYAPNPTGWVDPLGLYADSVTTTCARDPAFCASVGISGTGAAAVGGAVVKEATDKPCTSGNCDSDICKIIKEKINAAIKRIKRAVNNENKAQKSGKPSKKAGYEGHLQNFNDTKVHLMKLLKEANDNKCFIDPRAFIALNKKYPPPKG